MISAVQFLAKEEVKKAERLKKNAIALYFFVVHFSFGFWSIKLVCFEGVQYEIWRA